MLFFKKKPKYCRECGEELVEIIERGSWEYRNELWTMLVCKNRTPLLPDHDRILWKSKPYKGKFNQITGRKLDGS